MNYINILTEDEHKLIQAPRSDILIGRGLKNNYNKMDNKLELKIEGLSSKHVKLQIADQHMQITYMGKNQTKLMMYSMENLLNQYEYCPYEEHHFIKIKSGSQYPDDSTHQIFNIDITKIQVIRIFMVQRKVGIDKINLPICSVLIGNNKNQIALAALTLYFNKNIRLAQEVTLNVVKILLNQEFKEIFIKSANLSSSSLIEFNGYLSIKPYYQQCMVDSTLQTLFNNIQQDEKLITNHYFTKSLQSINRHEVFFTMLLIFYHEKTNQYYIFNNNINMSTIQFVILITDLTDECMGDDPNVVQKLQVPLLTKIQAIQTFQVKFKQFITMFIYADTTPLENISHVPFLNVYQQLQNTFVKAQTTGTFTTVGSIVKQTAETTNKIDFQSLQSTQRQTPMLSQKNKNMLSMIQKKLQLGTEVSKSLQQTASENVPPIQIQQQTQVEPSVQPSQQTQEATIEEPETQADLTTEKLPSQKSQQSVRFKINDKEYEFNDQVVNVSAFDKVILQLNGKTLELITRDQGDVVPINYISREEMLKW